MKTTETISLPTLAEFNSLKEEVERLKKRLDIAEQHSLEWVSVDQAKEYLNCCRQTVYALCASGEITKKQGKRKIEISLKSIREYNAKHTVKV